SDGPSPCICRPRQSTIAPGVHAMSHRTAPIHAALLAALLAAGPCAAAIHCVANTAQLQLALSLAVSDSDDHEIRLMTGTYPVPTFPPPTGFQYVSSQPGDLTVSGGWTSLTVGAPGCDLQVGDPSLTVLDAEYQSTVFRVQPGEATGSVTIRNLTLYRGS